MSWGEQKGMASCEAKQVRPMEGVSAYGLQGGSRKCQALKRRTNFEVGFCDAGDVKVSAFWWW